VNARLGSSGPSTVVRLMRTVQPCPERRPPGGPGTATGGAGIVGRRRRRRGWRRRSHPFAALVAATLLAGCGGSGEADDNPGGDGPTGPGGGSGLTLGEPYDDRGLQVTPVRVVEGSPDDLVGVDLEPEDQGSTPYYLHVRFENTSEEPANVLSANHFRVLDGDGRELTELVLILGDAGGCEQGGAPTDLAAGGTHETCRVFLAPPGSVPSTVRHDVGGDTAWQVPAGEVTTRDEMPAGAPGGEPLPFGQPYTFPDGHTEAQGLTVTPVEVVEGSPDDLASFDLSAEERAMTPWYVRMQYRDPDRTVRDVELSSVSFNLRVLDAAGEPLEELALAVPTGTFPTCETPSRMSDGEEMGGSYETCNIYLAPTGVEPATVGFAFDVVSTAEVTWRR
jgi:hypothetical protein